MEMTILFKECSALWNKYKISPFILMTKMNGLFTENYPQNKTYFLQSPSYKAILKDQ